MPYISYNRLRSTCYGHECIAMQLRDKVLRARVYVTKGGLPVVHTPWLSAGVLGVSPGC